MFLNLWPRSNFSPPNLWALSQGGFHLLSVLAHLSSLLSEVFRLCRDQSLESLFHNHGSHMQMSILGALVPKSQLGSTGNSYKARSRRSQPQGGLSPGKGVLESRHLRPCRREMPTWPADPGVHGPCVSGLMLHATWLLWPRNISFNPPSIHRSFPSSFLPSLLFILNNK